MRYCRKCILPDTRPKLVIGADGICNACAGHSEKRTIDWAAREKDFLALVREAKAKNRPYDCLVPVSGGKDSTYQVAKCLEHGLKILAVTWRTPGRTRIGQENLDNLIRLGVDHIDFSVSPEVERKFTYKALVRTGSTGVPMHFGLYIIPLRFAVDMGIPLVMWGESPSMEYGGDREERSQYQLDHRFLKTHGILQGTLIEDWIDSDLTARDLEIYRLPGEEAFREAEIKSVYIGYFFDWSPQQSLRVARSKGFKVREEGPKVGYYDFADIDCDFISIHHYFKWLKFGLTRLADNLSLEIRNGNMTRDESLAILKREGAQTPHADIDRLCAFLGITLTHFWEIAEKFRNPALWTREDGTWKLKDFIIPDWKWPDGA